MVTMKTPILALVLFAACGDDPVNYSAPVGIELKAKSGDVTNNAINEEKGITTESGNPYGAFISEAKAKLGHDPSEIEIDKVTLTLNIAKSTNIATIDQAITGNTTVQFIMNDTNDPFTVAHFASPTGVGPVDGTVDFDWSAVGGDNVAKMVAGSFKVAMAAPPATDFATKGAEASLTVTFTFTAFE
jgi:hypothetical protein